MTVNLRNKRLGMVNTNNDGCEMKIIRYNKATDILVEFQDKYKNITHTSYSAFIKGEVKNQSYRLGERSMNNQGCIMEIVEYKNCDDICVRFEDAHSCRIHTTYDSFIKGGVLNPYYLSVYGIGFLGQGEYVAYKNGKNTKEYDVWHNMLARIYNKNLRGKRPTYKDKKVCNEWHNFQNFARWYKENYYEMDDNIKVQIDKDILIKNNKIYSPETCVFVPSNINSLFTKKDKNRGDLPIGVTHRKNSEKYRALCMNQFTDKQVSLGEFDTPTEAFNSYKKYKEQHIKDIADYYKTQIPTKLYKALYKYEVSITD